MTAARRDVYLLCSRRPIVAEFCLLSETVAQSGKFDPVLVVPDGLMSLLPETLPHGSRVVMMGRRAWRAAGRSAYLRYVAFAILRRLSKILRLCGMRLAADFLDTWEAVARGKALARFVLALSDTTAAVLTADDRDIRVDQGVLLQARRRGIFTLACAFGKSDPVTDTLRRSSPDFDAEAPPWRFLKAKIAHAYPAGVRVAPNGRRVLFFKPGDFLALRAHQALFPVPWSYGGGTADKASVIDREAADMLRGLGVPDSKIVIGGQCSHDVLWALRERREAIRARLASEHGLDADRPLMVLALPVLGEHGMSTTEKQVDDTLWLFNTLSKAAHGNILVSLHPRQDRAFYEPLAKTRGVKLARLPLRDILAASDLFIAYSSTISWAQLLGIPSIALEYYELGYVLFAGQPGVVAVTERDALSGTSRDLLSEGPKRAALVSGLAALRESVPFDGKARERLINEIEKFNAKGPTCVSLD